ncbi:MAG: integrase core domain-containing protein [Candidatus Binatia bacterium]
MRIIRERLRALAEERPRLGYRRVCDLMRRLNAHWVLNLAHARQTIEHWRTAYTTVRSQSALGGQPAEEFAPAFTNNGDSRIAVSLS